LIRNAFENPVEFGQTNKSAIHRYIKIADLQLREFSEAKDQIEAALKSQDPWERYWGLIVCSTFSEKALDFEMLAKKITQNDSELINRVRAAEFLGIAKKENPVDVMTGTLYQTQDNTEALLILNSVVLMSEMQHNFLFDIDDGKR